MVTIWRRTPDGSVCFLSVCSNLFINNRALVGIPVVVVVIHLRKQFLHHLLYKHFSRLLLCGRFHPVLFSYIVKVLVCVCVCVYLFRECE